jgi:voltage-gated potassium channel
MDDLTTGQRRRLLVRGLLRAALTAAGLVAIYFLLPLDDLSDTYLVVWLAIGGTGLMGVIGWQVRAIIRSTYPAIRAVQALAVSTPLFLLFFAATYFMLSSDDPSRFSERLSRSDAVYFTVTVFSTVGFGDITPRGELTRLVVTAQMLLDLVILGLGIQVIIGAVQRGRAE